MESTSGGSSWHDKDILNWAVSIVAAANSGFEQKVFETGKLKKKKPEESKQMLVVPKMAGTLEQMECPWRLWGSRINCIWIITVIANISLCTCWNVLRFSVSLSVSVYMSLSRTHPYLHKTGRRYLFIYLATPVLSCSL